MVSDEALRLFYNGRRSFQHQEYENAEKYFSQAVNLAPDFADGYIGLGMVGIKTQASPETIWPCFEWQ